MDQRRYVSLSPICIQCFLILLSCAPKESGNQSISAALDIYFIKEFPPDEPGGAVLLIKGDSVIFSKGYGLANLETREVITPNTLFNLGSISKTFVANAILLLQEQGKLSVEDSLYKYFPNFKNKGIAQTVKIKHLLTHTSGLPDNRKVAMDTAFYLTAEDEENWYPVTQTDTLVFEPGSQFEYSNPAFNGLALILEKVSGMKWQQFVVSHVLEPSGMARSTITDGSHPEQGVSHAYVKNHGKWIEDDYGEEPTFPAAGNGGVWSSLDELSKYEKAIQQSVFLTPEGIVDSRTVKRFENWRGTIPFTASWSWFKPVKQNNSYSPIIGWSWFIGMTPTGSKIVGHTGSQGGFLCNYVSIPEKRVLLVILCNAPRDVYGYSDKVMTLLKL
jgi:CubicO group peptidase (beta-lactamase class C family)